MSDAPPATVSVPTPGPLLLRTGDPLPPPVTVEGTLQPEALAGRYALLLVGLDAHALPALDEALDRLNDKARGRLRCHAVLDGPGGDVTPRHVEVHVDDARVTARRWGALTGVSDRAPLAIVLEPRGRVQACLSAQQPAEALIAALRAASLLP